MNGIKSSELTLQRYLFSIFTMHTNKIESTNSLFHRCSRRATQLLTYLFMDMCHAHQLLYLLFAE